jgi:NAD(P) transhydrogenase
VFQYEIVRLLGAGGMGEVYAAKDTQLGRDVAIKVASEHLGDTWDMRTRLEHEARAVAALSHPAIVAIYEFASVGNRPFVVMELLQGETLRARLTRSAIGWRSAASMIAFAAEGVAAAHSKGIVHRDLKPDNLFLCDDGTVKVLDFGLARRNTLTDVPTAVTLTAPGTLVGTLGYMAPEQIRGDRADARADVFALGCTLLEAVTGARAFDADSAAGVLSAVLGREPAGLEEVEELCSELGVILRRALAKSPEERYSTAGEFADALRSVLNQTAAVASTARADIPVRSHYDVVVIGGDLDGQRWALDEAQNGRHVAVVAPNGRLGGLSLHRGAVTSAAFVQRLLQVRGAPRSLAERGYAVRDSGSLADLVSLSRAVKVREHGAIVGRLVRAGVTVIDGTATFVGPRSLEVSGRDFTVHLEASTVVIAPGLRPSRHSLVDNDGVFDPEGLLQLRQLPRELAIVGEGATALEYSSMFAELGARVTLLDQRSPALDFVDEEVLGNVLSELRRRGVVIRRDEAVAGITREPGRTVVELHGGRRVYADAVLCVDRLVPDTASLNLEAAGLAPDSEGRIPVDASGRTAVPHIFGAGAVVTAAPSLCPFALFTVPEVAGVGCTEQQLRRENRPYELGVARYADLARAQLLNDECGMLKLLIEPVTFRLQGVHIVGIRAAELVHIGQVLIAAGGSALQLRTMKFNHPTFAEAFALAAADALSNAGRSGS